jgi:hypothetical protein
MRPQDILILFAILLKKGNPFVQANLADDLWISPSEITKSLARSRVSGLLSAERKVNAGALHEFLVGGLRYVFPAEIGSNVLGLPTAHSAPPLAEVIVNNDLPYVWKYRGQGSVRGVALRPLYDTVVDIALTNASLYELLALCDALRIGKARERTLAAEALKARFDRY